MRPLGVRASGDPARPRVAPRRPVSAARGDARASRRGRALLTLLLLGLVGALAVQAWRRSSEAAGFGWIDPARSDLLPPELQLSAHLDPRPPWVDPRWRDETAHRLARFRPFRTDDEETQRALAQTLADLSFVEAVARPEVVWPDGLRVPLRLRQPVACLAVGDAFQPVAADGTLLSGRWDAPPAWGAAWLPTVHLGDGDAEVLARRLVEGLAVARSLQQHLTETDQARLGRAVLDTAAATAADPLERRVDLVLEDGRLAVFGRAPSPDRPGELPASAKWRSLVQALDLADAGGEGAAWSLVDLRWDRPELRLEQEPEEASGADGAGG